MKQFYKTFLAASSIILVSACVLSSCRSRNAADDKRQAIIESFVAAHKAFVKTNPDQDKFFNKFTETINALDENRTASINTQELDTLMKLAKDANAQRKELVNKNVVEDSIVRYHTKANDLINSADSFYLKFPELIRLLQTTNEDRYEKYLRLMTEPMRRMRRAQEKYQEASDSMSNKYDIRVTL